MMTTNAAPRPPVQPGELAPDFTVPAAYGDGALSVTDYRGRSPVLLALFRGLYCPFCRRNVVLLSEIGQKLKELGVETLGVVATSPERTRLFFKYRPPRIRVGADPELSTHQAYGLPNLPHTPEIEAALHPAAYRELGGRVPIERALETLKRLDGYAPAPEELADSERHHAQIEGQFLVDRDGVVRWANIEGARDTLDGIGQMPSAEELLAQARAL